MHSLCSNFVRAMPNLISTWDFHAVYHLAWGTADFSFLQKDCMAGRTLPNTERYAKIKSEEDFVLDRFASTKTPREARQWKRTRGDNGRILAKKQTALDK
jgi:hypothetical protein